MCGWRAALYAVLFLGVLMSVAQSATFQGLEVIPDGSFEPPGDLLKLKLVFYPSDDVLRAEVRAYVIPIFPVEPPAVDNPDAPEVELPEPEPQRVRTTREAVSDSESHYLQTVTIQRPPGATNHMENLIVAFRDLSLGVGSYRLGYEVLVYRGETLQFASATPLTRIEITAEPRVLTEKMLQLEAREEPVELVVLRNGVLIAEQNFETTTTEFYVPGTSTVQVEGGFRRQQEFMAAAAGEDATPEDMQALDVNMGRKPWKMGQAPVMYFATNRRVIPDAPVKQRFTNEDAGFLTYGSVRVNLPWKDFHDRGQLETPRWWNRLDPKKHFFLEEITNTLSEAEIFAVLANSIQTKDGDLLVFVHGFDNTFEDAALRLAQLRHDANFPGQALLFSWPSVGGTGKANYLTDEIRSRNSIRHLAAVLTRIARDRAAMNEPGDIHLIAHSMGNRVLLGALLEIAADPQLAGHKPFGHVIFAAPDENAATYQIQATRILPLGNSCTHYFCLSDKALLASQVVHGNDNHRAGQVLIPLTGLDNVDARKANTSFLGHDYFVSENPLLGDLQMLFNFDSPPLFRMPPLKLETNSGYPFWSFP